MTLYLQQVLGLSAIEAGLVYLPGTLVMFLVSGATSAVGEKVSARRAWSPAGWRSSPPAWR